MTKKIFFIALFVSGIFGFTAKSQQLFDFSFERDLSIQVKDSSGIPLKNPWAGGINAVHFNEIDLNFDGIMDLVTFDAQTERLRTYINNGTANTVDYVYAPQYEKGFPKIYSWMKLRDFNCDGKPDIFTYNFGGIKVYINVSSPTNGIVFKLYTPMINAYQTPYVNNIMATSVDYPAIHDIDGDGDLDILVFYGLGSFIKYYENLSMDNTGTCDTLWMRLNHNCWGYVFESEISNSMYLHIDSTDPAAAYYCHSTKGEQTLPLSDNNRKERHTGSTMTMLDLTNNGLQDLLLGDTDYPSIIALYNYGTLDTARITMQDTFFPSYNLPINIYALSNTDYIDVDNDGVKDLLAGVLDPGVTNHKIDNINNSWFYKNIGTNSLPVFSHQTKRFLQDGMIDVGSYAYPVLYDYNGNGLKDLFIGSYGLRDTSFYDPWLNLESTYRARIWLYENTGTP
ncbi:MAG: FG-GAP-like repeat-containing protein, partial [Bacteroidales bacterium]|nr:FG-GAP-like repeat-containing protein [Bacteroidales bacterium]